MEKIFYVESRTHEIAFITPIKAPEMIASIIEARYAVIQHYSDIMFQLTIAQRRMKQRAGIITIDQAPAIIKEKGLSSNAETRNALIEVDDDYNDAAIVYGALEAGVVMFKEKLRALTDAQAAVREILHDTSSTLKFNNPELGKHFQP